MTETSTPPSTDRDRSSARDTRVLELVGRISRLEILVGATIAAIMAVLVVLEPDILEAPFENGRTLLFTVGGTALAAIAFVAMLWLRVPAVVRVVVLVVPFVLVNWWLISPYFIDDVVDEDFSTSISEQLATVDESPESPESPAAPPASAAPEVEDERTTGSAPVATNALPPTEPAQQESAAAASEPVTQDASDEAPTEQEPPPAAAPSGPALLGAGSFVGLAGHSGTGDAGIFQNADGSLVLRFENFDIENGPDLEVYFVLGADQTSLPEGSIHLGPLKGNIGDQNYDLPPGTELAPGAYTALVWCEAFSVEFVGATIAV